MEPAAAALLLGCCAGIAQGAADLAAWVSPFIGTDSMRLAEPLRFGDGVRWLGLAVKRHVVHDADHATVEFVARSKLGGRASRLHETSRFVREGDRWFCVDGDTG